MPGERPQFIGSRRDVLRGALGIGMGMALGADVFSRGTAAQDAGPAQIPNTTPSNEELDVLQHPEVNIQQTIEQIDGFTWEHVNDPEALRTFIDDMSRVYLGITQSQNLREREVLGRNEINFFYEDAEYDAAIAAVNPDYQAGMSSSQWGTFLYQNEQIYLNIPLLRGAIKKYDGPAGLVIANAQWHEIGHEDVKIRVNGDLLNNPEYTTPLPDDIAIRVNGGTKPAEPILEPWDFYRGGRFFTENYWGFGRVEEAWNEANTAMMIREHLGMNPPTSQVNGDYHRNGVDILPRVIRVSGMSWRDSYELHATSNLEKFMERIGTVLPGEGDAMGKGYTLMIGIHNDNSELIRSSGVYTLLDG